MKTTLKATATLVCLAVTALFFIQANPNDPLADPTAKSKSSDPVQVLICHNPSGQPGNEQDLWVNANALQAHLAHGDKLGSCTEDNSCADCKQAYAACAAKAGSNAHALENCVTEYKECLS